MMAPNLGTADRVVRALFALALLGLCLTGQITGTAAIVVGVVAVLLGVSSLTARCPTYVPFGLSTLDDRSVRRRGR